MVKLVCLPGGSWQFRKENWGQQKWICWRSGKILIIIMIKVVTIIYMYIYVYMYIYIYIYTYIHTYTHTYTWWKLITYGAFVKIRNNKEEKKDKCKCVQIVSKEFVARLDRKQISWLVILKIYVCLHSITGGNTRYITWELACRIQVTCDSILSHPQKQDVGTTPGRKPWRVNKGVTKTTHPHYT